MGSKTQLRINGGENIESDYYKRLETAKRKLNALVDEALENGTPIDETHDIMDQCKKIKLLIADALQDEGIQAQSREVDEILGEME